MRDDCLLTGSWGCHTVLLEEPLLVHQLATDAEQADQVEALTHDGIGFLLQFYALCSLWSCSIDPICFLAGWHKRRPESGFSFVRFNFTQGDHLSGKPGNVREFDSCQGNVRYFNKSQGNVREKILSGKSGLKLLLAASIQVFSRSLFCVKY